MAVTLADLNRISQGSQLAQQMGGPLSFTQSTNGQRTYTPQFTGNTVNGRAQVLQAAPGQPGGYQAPQSSGGGGGGAYGGYGSKNAWFHALTGGDIAPAGWNGPSQAQGPSQEDIDNAFNPLYSDIQGLRNNALANRQSYLDAATNPYEALRPGLDQARTEGMNLNAQQVNDTNSRQANALSAARQLFNELSQGVQQRFGGTGSTSDFAKAFYGRQLQQNEGNIYQTTGQNLQSLQMQAQNINSQYQNNVKQLEAQKASALSQAQVDFQDKLDQIDQLRLQTDQQKAQAKLAAVQELKNTANAINMQFTQFQQQMALQQQAQAAYLQNAFSQYGQAAAQPVNLTQNPNLVFSAVGGGQGSYNPYQVVGSLRRDQNGNIA